MLKRLEIQNRSARTIIEKQFGQYFLKQGYRVVNVTEVFSGIEELKTHLKTLPDLEKSEILELIEAAENVDGAVVIEVRK